ncbi:hypothetical protein JCM3766R1_006074, partial [Sporobolomyces carnicolor]
MLEYVKETGATKLMRAAMRSFKLMLLVLSGSGVHGFEAKAFRFTHDTAYHYSSAPQGLTSVPPLLSSLRCLFSNEISTQEQIDMAIQDRDREGRVDAWNPDDVEMPEPAHDQTYYATDEEEEANDGDSSKRCSPDKYARDHFERLDRKTNKSRQRDDENLEEAADLRLSGVNHDSSRRFAGRRINGLHRLCPAERVAAICKSWPNRRFSEALASCAFFDVAPEEDQPEDEKDWLVFSLNEERVLKSCNAYATYMEVALPGKPKKLSRTERMTVICHLRHEVLNLIFDV